MTPKILLDVLAPMRDGIELSCDVYLPLEGDSFPVLLCRTLYSKESNPETDGARPIGYVGWAMDFVEAGYAVVIQDVRGRYDSEGDWEVYVQDEDGYDTIEWIATQPWCDGNVGMFGISYVGFTQMHPAPLASEHLKGILPIAATPDGFDLFWQQGAFLLQQASHFLQIGRRTSHPIGMAILAGLPAGTTGIGGGKAGAPAGDLSYLYERMPMLSAFEEFDDVFVWKEFLTHQTKDEYWRRRIVTDRYETITTPAYFLTGWWDCTVHHMFDAFTNWRRSASEEAAARTKIMVGPWTHTRIGVPDWGQDVEFGDSAQLDIVGHHFHWYDRRLKGSATGVDEEAPLQLYVCGDNEWRGEYEWPLARTEYRVMYLSSGGSANTRSGDGLLTFEQREDGRPDRYVYDPENPVPTLGGHVAYVDRSGPRDRAHLEDRGDILVYSTHVLDEDLECTGPITTVVYASSSAVDTDFTATLIDVFPDGKAINVTEGIVRARARNAGEPDTLIEPGVIYEYGIDLWEASWVFKAGHRLRLEISSSNFPRFDRNTNLGGTIGEESEMTPAEQTVYHDEKHASRLVLPVIPR
jgi:putative CocE/NonD family hydrolase